MLINISNAASEKWDRTQVKKANKKFGKIIDLPFPIISPTYTLKDVKNIAKEYLQRILLIGDEDLKNDELTIHLMGDCSFVFSLLTMLKKEKIKAVASTYLNITQMKDEAPSFKQEFIDFREYY